MRLGTADRSASLSPEQDAIVAKLRVGGTKALASLFDRHRPRLKNSVSSRIDRRILSRLDSSDVLQETFLTAERRLNEYIANPRMPFFAWLRFLAQQHTLAIHRHHFQSQKRDPAREIGSGDPEVESLLCELSQHSSSPQSDVIRGETRCNLESLLQALSANDREILTLVHLQDLTVSEAAESLKISVETARKRHFRAMKRLKSTSESLSRLS